MAVEERAVWHAGSRWHFTEPVEHRPGVTRLTACTRYPVRSTAPRPPAAVPEHERCQAHGCDRRWPTTDPGGPAAESTTREEHAHG